MYKNRERLLGNIGNNALSYNERMAILWTEPSLVIPALIDGNIHDVLLGEEIVFEEVQNGKLVSCKGLQDFVYIQDYGKEIAIFDNHNHALYFWLEWYKKGLIESWCELIHIDEHSDLWSNDNVLNLEEAKKDENYSFEFTNHSCNVGNYIQPVIKSWLIGRMIRIENEFQLDEYMDYQISPNTILNIDLDIFSPELDHIDEKKKVSCIQNLLGQAKFVTIATSPYFIEQWKALEKLHLICEKL